jgi:hypothetical protein
MENEKLKSLAISPNGFVFDPTTGHSYTTNDSGMFILQKFIEGCEISEVAQALTEIYLVEASEAERDVVALTEYLKSNYLV